MGWEWWARSCKINPANVQLSCSFKFSSNLQLPLFFLNRIYLMYCSHVDMLQRLVLVFSLINAVSSALCTLNTPNYGPRMLLFHMVLQAQYLTCLQAVTFHKCKNLRVKNLRIVNSQQMHISFSSCLRVVTSQLKVIAPAMSPNTDGIHITASHRVQVKKCIVRTGWLFSGTALYLSGCTIFFYQS